MSGNLYKRRGSLFLAMLVAIAAGGMIAYQILPDNSIKNMRENDLRLKINLGQIRQAFDMKYLTDKGYSPDLSSPANIKTELKKLADSNFLRDKNIKDPTIPNYLWDSQPWYFWIGTENFSTNSSFELLNSDSTIASWVLIPNTKAKSSSLYLSHSEIDDYPSQNKLGQTSSVLGKSLKITYP